MKLDGLISWWEEYVAMHGASLDNNPSPGNKRGGLTTILEKSLGAVAKGGRSPLNAVYRYAERVTEHGLGTCGCAFTAEHAFAAGEIERWPAIAHHDDPVRTCRRTSAAAGAGIHPAPDRPGWRNSWHRFPGAAR